MPATVQVDAERGTAETALTELIAYQSPAAMSLDMTKRTGIIEKSLLDRRRINDPQVVAEYEKTKAEQRKTSKPIELAQLMSALKAVEAEIISARRGPKARVDFLKRRKREAETAIKEWQYLNGFR